MLYVVTNDRDHVWIDRHGDGDGDGGVNDGARLRLVRRSVSEWVWVLMAVDGC